MHSRREHCFTSISGGAAASYCDALHKNGKIAPRRSNHDGNIACNKTENEPAWLHSWWPNCFKSISGGTVASCGEVLHKTGKIAPRLSNHVGNIACNKTENEPAWLHSWWQHNLTPISEEILASYNVVLHKMKRWCPSLEPRWQYDLKTARHGCTSDGNTTSHCSRREPLSHTALSSIKMER